MTEARPKARRWLEISGSQYWRNYVWKRAIISSTMVRASINNDSNSAIRFPVPWTLEDLIRRSSWYVLRTIDANTARTLNGDTTFRLPYMSISLPTGGPNMNRRNIWRVVIQANAEAVWFLSMLVWSWCWKTPHLCSAYKVSKRVSRNSNIQST